MNFRKSLNPWKILKSFLYKGKDRDIKAKKSSVFMLLLKGLSILLNLAFVPLLINVLNKEVYGIWLTITTIVGWIGFLDLGLGHGLRNKLASAIADGDKDLARSYTSTTYIALLLITLFLGLIQFALTPLIDWASILNAPPQMNEELKILVSWVVFLFCIQFLLKLITSIMLALQLPAFSSLVMTLGQLIAFIVVFVLVKTNINPSLLKLGLIISAAPVVVLLISSILLFTGKYSWLKPTFRCFNKDLIGSVLNLGTKFFFIQITALILFQSNNVIIAQIEGPESVTEFNIAYKYIGITSILFSIIAMPYWSATTEAFVKKDYEWINNSIKFLKKIWLFFVGVGVLMLFLAAPVYKLWLGGALSVNYLILSLTLIYFILYMRWTLYGSFLNGIGKIRFQLVVTLIMAFIHVPLAFVLGTKFGTAGVLASMIFVSLVNVVWPPVQLEKLLSGEANGIWNK